ARTRSARATSCTHYVLCSIPRSPIRLVRFAKRTSGMVSSVRSPPTFASSVLVDLAGFEENDEQLASLTDFLVNAGADGRQAHVRISACASNEGNYRSRFRVRRLRRGSRGCARHLGVAASSRLRRRARPAGPFKLGDLRVLPRALCLRNSLVAPI